MSRPWTDKDRLRELYVEKDLTYDEVADRLGCSVSTIKKWASEYNLGDEKKPWKDRNRMYRLYVKEDMTQEEVADTLDCSYSTVNKWLKEHDIPVRTHGGNFEKPWHDKETFQEVWESDMKTGDMAEELGCDVGTMYYWAERHGFRETEGPQPGSQRKPANKEECRRCGELFRVRPNKSDSVHQCSDCRSEFGHLEERNEKISESWNNTHGPEARRKMSESHTSKELTDEHRRNIGKANEGEKNDMYGVTGEDHPAYGHDGTFDSEWGEVEATGHYVKSSWEKEIDLLLHEAGVDYGYETRRFKFSELSYRPDFIVGNVVIEVKGLPTENCQRRAELVMEEHPNLTYVVVGNRQSPEAEIPCDVHIPWDERESLVDYL